MALGKPVRMVYSRTESIMSTTKRHPARMRVRAGCTRDGKLLAIDFAADFNTGAYSSWGPTVAGAGSGACFRSLLCAALSRADAGRAHQPGAGRGVSRIWSTASCDRAGTTLSTTSRIDVGMDRLEFRILNALDDDTPTVTGQVMGEGVGIRACFEALRPRWQTRASRAAEFNSKATGPLRRGVGVAGMWYGCGNTSLPNPSTVRIGLKRDGRIALHQGAVDIGQGSNTIVTQICADALGAPIDRFDLVSGDTAITPDCGKTSASRQTFVTGKAAHMAGTQLRHAILEDGGRRAIVRTYDFRRWRNCA